jgi:hypothetical protein
MRWPGGFRIDYGCWNPQLPLCNRKPFPFWNVTSGCIETGYVAEVDVMENGIYISDCVKTGNVCGSNCQHSAELASRPTQFLKLIKYISKSPTLRVIFGLPEKCMLYEIWGLLQLCPEDNTLLGRWRNLKEDLVSHKPKFSL